MPPSQGRPWGSAGPPDVWPCLADPDWASYTLGVFICLSCSGIHRNIPHVSKVKSVRLDSWEDVQVEVRPGRVPGGGPARCHGGLRPSPRLGRHRPLVPAAPPPPQGVLVPREPARASCCQGFMGNLHRVAEGDRCQGLHLPSTHPESRAHPASMPTQSPHVP